MGFRISEKIIVRDSDTSARMISAVSMQGNFQAEIERLIPGKSYYIRAFAENSVGLKYGSVRRIKVKKDRVIPFDAQSVDDNWYMSDWFGGFKYYNSQWVFHQELGWLFHGPVGGNGIWFWSDQRNWTWTKKGLWPYLWIEDQGNWFYYLGNREGNPYFWNFLTNSITD